MTGDRDGVGVDGAEAMVKFVGKEEVCEFALSVGFPWIVFFITVEVTEANFAHAVSDATDGDNARLWCIEQGVEEVSCESEVAKVVCAKLHLEAVLGGALGDGHDASVIDEDIEAIVAQSQKRSAVYDVVTNPTNVTVAVNKTTAT